MTTLRKHIVTRLFASICPATTIQMYWSICGGENSDRYEAHFWIRVCSRMPRKERAWLRTQTRRRPQGWKCLRRPSARMTLPPNDTQLGYAITLERNPKDERSIAGDGTHVLHSRSYYQALVASVFPRSQEKSNRSLSCPRCL